MHFPNFVNGDESYIFKSLDGEFAKAKNYLEAIQLQFNHKGILKSEQ
jgi:hypothetical protein